MKARTLLLLVLAAAGCKKDEIEVYKIAKDNSEAASPAAAPAAPEEAGLRWQVPKDWRAKPGDGMRLATFLIPGGAGTVELSVVSLPGDAGGELANVNRWRGQLGLAPLDDGSLKKESSRVESPAGELLLVDFAPRDPQAGTRLMASILSKDGKTWFFKATGPAGAVSAAKPAFLRFLKTLR